MTGTRLNLVSMLHIIPFFPGEQEPLGDFSLVTSQRAGKERAVEPALYISDEFEISPNFTVSGGLRATYFTSFGPETEFIYAENSPRTVENIN